MHLKDGLKGRLKPIKNFLRKCCGSPANMTLPHLVSTLGYLVGLRGRGRGGKRVGEIKSEREKEVRFILPCKSDY